MLIQTKNMPVYDILEHNDEYLILADKDIGRSLTNGIEDVLVDFRDNQKVDIDSLKIIYRDSDGYFDAVKLTTANTVKFMPLRKRNLEEAILEYSNRYTTRS